MVVRFGDVELDLQAFELRRDGRPIHIEPQVFEVVRYLVTHRDRLVPKEELLEQVWGTRFVSESALTSRIKTARRVLGDDGREQRVIRTVHGRGYRFVAPDVTEDVEYRPDGATPNADRRPLRDTTGVPLLERDGALAVLDDAVADAGTGRGRVVLVTGDAGMGKTTLVRAMASATGAAGRVLIGACDDLVTPLPLGPLRDVAARVDPAFGQALDSPSPGDAQRALLDELTRPPSPTVLVIEDAHWADEATIDALVFVTRRLADVPAAIVMTYRDNEVAGTHPLARLLGAIPPELCRRIELLPFSSAAVAALMGEERVEEVLAATGGVPFFVTELAAAASTETTAGEPLPTSVSRAVLSRVARLPEPTARLLDLLAVGPTRTDADLLDALRATWVDDIEPAERGGIVSVDAQAVAFRHELARRAVLDTIPAARRRQLHREVGAALAARGGDPALIVHHAEAGGDTSLLAEHALHAARRASVASAHREAWSHYQRLLSLEALIPEDDRAIVLEEASHEAYATSDPATSLELGERALAEFRRSGDELAIGRVHRWLSRIHWFEGRGLQSQVQAQLAVKVLEPLPPSVELAWAYSNLSQLAMLSWRRDETLRWGERSIALAQELGADDVRVHALVNVGAEHFRADLEDEGPLWNAVAEGEAVGEHHEVARAMGNLGYTLMTEDRPARAGQITEQGLAYAEQHEVETLRQYLVAMQGHVALLEGRWDEAGAALGQVVGAGSSVPQLLALTSLALLQVRKGDHEAAATFDQAWPLVEAAGEPQRIVPLAEVEAERAWLVGRLDPSTRRLEYAFSVSSSAPGAHGRLAVWLHEAGGLETVPPDVPEPYRSELEGRWSDAAAIWRERGMPYEEARALSRGGEEDRRRAIEIAERLGAVPLLRRLGVST
jgi:DNA-binding winged helix-turn-helix (wHTH) protein/energy-coupling factor transporter ATP-binding protein EcfA2